MATATKREPLATTKQVAEYLNRRPQTLRKWRCLGEGPPWTGRNAGVRYRWSDVEKWLNQQQAS